MRRIRAQSRGPGRPVNTIMADTVGELTGCVLGPVLALNTWGFA